MLELEQVSLQRAGKRLLWQVSLQAIPGELCVILGPNGAGKSTLLQVMSGYLRPDSGRVRLGGQDTVGLSAARLASLRAVVEQQATVPSGWRVSELVAAGSYFAAPGQQAAAMDTEGRARCVYCGSGILAAYYLDARCCEHVCSLCGGRLYRTGFEG